MPLLMQLLIGTSTARNVPPKGMAEAQRDRANGLSLWNPPASSTARTSLAIALRLRLLPAPNPREAGTEWASRHECCDGALSRRRLAALLRRHVTSSPLSSSASDGVGASLDRFGRG